MVMGEDKRATGGGSGTRDVTGVYIGMVFLLLAIWLVAGPDAVSVPSRDMVMVDARDIAPESLRIAMADPPTFRAGGYDLKCRECHKLFPSRPETARTLTQHQNIVLDHGLNDRCFNCHDRDDRDRLVVPGLPSVAFAEVPRMCASCHGTVYRDWQKGMHGRTSGHWDPAYGEQRRLACGECHDPHAPAIGSMSALPGPNTLRMGDPSAASREADEGRHNPLRPVRDNGASSSPAVRASDADGGDP